jgi:hypothetical protein
MLEPAEQFGHVDVFADLSGLALDQPFTDAIETARMASPGLGDTCGWPWWVHLSRCSCLGCAGGVGVQPRITAASGNASGYIDVKSDGSRMGVGSFISSGRMPPQTAVKATHEGEGRGRSPFAALGGIACTARRVASNEACSCISEGDVSLRSHPAAGARSAAKPVVPAPPSAGDVAAFTPARPIVATTRVRTASSTAQGVEDGEAPAYRSRADVRTMRPARHRCSPSRRSPRRR